MKFEEVIGELEKEKCIARMLWNNNTIANSSFIFKQIPAEISIEVVPKMQSLPDSVKKIFNQRFELTNFVGENNKFYNSIKYINQVVKVDNENNITYYIPSGEDIFAEDWYII